MRHYFFKHEQVLSAQAENSAVFYQHFGIKLHVQYSALGAVCETKLEVTLCFRKTISGDRGISLLLFPEHVYKKNNSDSFVSVLYKVLNIFQRLLIYVGILC